MMRLNGSVYLGKPAVLDTITGCVEHIKNAEYSKVSSSIGDVPTAVKNETVERLIEFRDKLVREVLTENFVKQEDLEEAITEAKYDPKRCRVGKYQTGAFGLRIKADDEACIKYVFNICIHIIAKRISEIKN